MVSKQLIDICNELGIKIIIKNKIIKEDKGYYENYHQIEKEGINWYYSLMNFEKRPEPGKEDVIEFKEEQEAVKYFFIKILKQYYFEKIFAPNNSIRKINTIEELIKFFRQLDIIESCYNFTDIRPQGVFTEIIDNKMIISFIDEKKQKKFSTLPLNFKDGFLEMYRLTYSLHLLKTVERKFLQKNILIESFNDNDIELFIK